MAAIVPAPQTPETAESLAPFLALAASWSLDTPERTAAEVLADARLARYVAGWGRPGDLAVLAYEDTALEGTAPNDTAPETTEPVGAAWLRLFPTDEPGMGFVSAGIPELTVAVDRDHQGEGLGTRLVQALLGMARLSGVESVSLSVEQANGAIVLFSRLGFEEIGVAGGASIMLKQL